jgi:hypothetical protein
VLSPPNKCNLQRQTWGGRCLPELAALARRVNCTSSRTCSRAHCVIARPMSQPCRQHRSGRLAAAAAAAAHAATDLAPHRTKYRSNADGCSQTCRMCTQHRQWLLGVIVTYINTRRVGVRRANNARQDVSAAGQTVLQSEFRCCFFASFGVGEAWGLCAVAGALVAAEEEVLMRANFEFFGPKRRCCERFCGWWAEPFFKSWGTPSLLSVFC